MCVPAHIGFGKTKRAILWKRTTYIYITMHLTYNPKPSHLCAETRQKEEMSRCLSGKRRKGNKKKENGRAPKSWFCVRDKFIQREITLKTVYERKSSTIARKGAKVLKAGIVVVLIGLRLSFFLLLFLKISLLKAKTLFVVTLESDSSGRV